MVKRNLENKAGLRIAVSDLRRAVDVVAAHLEATGQVEFVLEEDFYWHVPQATRYDNQIQPEVLDLGQLSDDWMEVSAILAGEKPPIGYALVWLASLMLCVGERSRG
jgi:hypothetical protein